MGNCVLVDQGLSLDITELEALLSDYYKQNYSDEYIPGNLPEACHSHYCSVFGDHIPAFLMALSILGLLSNLALGTALAKFPRLWDQHHPSKIVLSLLTVATGIFATVLLVFAAGGRFEDTFCKAARAMQYGSLFAQGLLVAGSSCQLPWDLPCLLLPTALWAAGFLLSIPTAMISGLGDDHGATCALSPQNMRHPWSAAHTILCLADFLLLPVLVGLAKAISKRQQCNWPLQIGPTWLFYLLWAPYGVATILKILVQEGLLTPSCPSQEALDFFLGLSEGLGMLHCALCPMFILGGPFLAKKLCKRTGTYTIPPTCCNS